MREKIISAIKNELLDNDKVYAFWLEGADGLNNVDEYSDIDMVFDVEDGYEEEVFKTIEIILSNFGNLDLAEENNVNHPKIRQKVFHIKNTSEYLLIDCDIQSHSRNSEESCFTKGDIVSFPRVIFDKDNIVTFKETTEVDVDLIKSRIEELELRYAQHSRVIKYVKRGLYLEAYMYYNKFVADPLVELLRLLYTPEYFYLHMIHISHHVPKIERNIIEKFYKVCNLSDITNNTEDSVLVFKRLVDKVKKKYNIK